MPVLEGKVITKWTENPIPFVTIRIADYEFETDEEGKFSIELTKGTVKIEAEKEGYEKAVVSLLLVANSTISIIMAPILRAL